VIEHRLVRGAILAHAGVPFRHVPRFSGLEAEAEAEPDLAVGRSRARHQHLFARGGAHRAHVHEGQAHHRPWRLQASASRLHASWQACAAGASVLVRRQICMQAVKLPSQVGASPPPVTPL